MALKLSVSEKVVVPMKFNMKDGATLKQFAFALICTRLTAEEFQASIKGDDGKPSNDKIKETMFDITTDWKGQTLVLDDDNHPAEFSREALELMYGAVGVLDLAVSGYMSESAAKAKN